MAYNKVGLRQILQGGLTRIVQRAAAPRVTPPSFRGRQVSAFKIRMRV